ncbi:MAG: PAS domain-containing protein [Pseudomonadota bacterium]
MDASSLPVTILARPDHTDDLHFFHINTAFEELSGYSKEEIVGMDCTMLEGEETDPAAVKLFWDDMRRVRNALTTIVNYRKDGSAYETFVIGAQLQMETPSKDVVALYLCGYFPVEELTMLPPKWPSGLPGTFH